MNKKWSKVIFFVFWVGAFSAYGERLGTLEIEELSLRVETLVYEGQGVELSLSKSLLGFRWNLDKSLGAKIVIGSLSLINVPVYFKSSPKDDLGIDDLGVVEAYGEYISPYGSFRMGLLPLEYSVKGSSREGDLELPRNLLFKNKVLGLRDRGLEFATSHKGYFTNITVHNGEGGKNLDNRVWLTTSWGWTDEDEVVVGFNGRTGSTKPSSTSESDNILAGVDSKLEAKWRMGTAFIHWTSFPWKVILEGTWGTVRQENKKGERFEAGHFDLGYDLSSNFGLLGRIDYFDPNDKQKHDAQKEISLAWVWKSREGNSRFYFIATHIQEEGPKVNNDELRLVWQLSPEMY